MDGKALFTTIRAGQPGLRELPGGPPTVAQPSRVDNLRAARFDAYRARIGQKALTPATPRPPGRDPGAWRTLSAAAAAYRQRAAEARAREADPAAADIARRGRAAVAGALRHHPRVYGHARCAGPGLGC
jgi:hypothetical protein